MSQVNTTIPGRGLYFEKKKKNSESLKHVHLIDLLPLQQQIPSGIFLQTEAQWAK